MRESQAIHDCVIVFVAGGFHAPALTAFMRDHNLNYTVWRPQPEPAVSMPKGYFYPPYRLNASSRRVYFLRPPGGFSLPGGVPFVRRLILSSDHRLPPSGWPSPDEEKRSAWRQFSNATEWAWKTLRASFPSLNLFKIPTDPRNVSYVASTVRLLAKAAGQNADRFADGLNSILTRGVPREIQEEAYAAVDLDSYGLENFLAQGNHLLRLFSALQARAERPSASGGRVVFFSSRLREIQKEKINNLINSANRRSKGIGFSFIERSTQNDIAQLFIENGIPDANLREDNVFILSTSDIGYENAKYVPIKGLPHLALAVFAYTHFKDAQSVLDRLVRLFERLTSLRMDGSLNKRIMAELISKTSA